MKHFRKGFSLAVMALSLSAVTCSCSKEYDDSSIWSTINSHEKRLSSLEELCSKINSDLGSLSMVVQAISASNMVTSVIPVTEGGMTIGYTICFSKSAPVTIFHGKDGQDGRDGTDGGNGLDGKDGTNGKDGLDGKDGKDGRSPAIGIEQDKDGDWYWTLDGEWLTDSEGMRVKANGSQGVDGKTPTIRIEDGWWHISYDGGKNWERLGQASGAPGKDAEGLIKSLTETEDRVTIVLNDGKQIGIPKYREPSPLTLTVGGHDEKLNDGGSIEVTFTVEGGIGEVKVMAITQGGWKASATMLTPSQGILNIQAPVPFSHDKITILAIDGKGRTAMASLSFAKAEARAYSVSADGKSLKVNISDTTFIMSRVPHGSFTMGDGTQVENQGASYGVTNPKHEVTLTKDFWVGQRALEDKLLARFPSIDQSMVSYAGESYTYNTRNFIEIKDVASVLEAIGSDCGLKFRLLTEAEAEYAFIGGYSTGGTQVQDWMSYSNGWFSWGFDISKDACDPAGPPSKTPMSWPAEQNTKTLEEAGLSSWYKVRKGSGNPRKRLTTRRYPVILALDCSETE